MMKFNDVILGCSTFTLGLQFGHRSRLYELDFMNQPENILEIIDKVYEMNVNNIMLKANKDLETALNQSIDNGNDWKIIGFSECNDINADLELFNNYDTKTVILSGEFVDKNIEEENYDVIKEYLSKIKDNSYIPAIETCRPFKNIPLIAQSSLMDNFDALLIPFNFYGYMMDCNFFNKENRDIFEKTVKDLNKEIIARRTLATGILKPQEAYDFIKEVDYINSVCVGVAKKSEAEETFGIINNI